MLRNITQEDMENLFSVDKDKSRVELFATLNVSMELKAMDLSVGDNAQREHMNVVHFVSLRENLAAIFMYLDK